MRIQNSTIKHIINFIFRPLSLKVLYSRGAMFLVFVNLKIGTPRFRKAIADLIPSETVMQLREIINIFHETSVEILETKKAALRRGDQALADQIGQGKDIISILCAISFLPFTTFHS